jgi:hypothetical protein
MDETMRQAQKKTVTTLGHEARSLVLSLAAMCMVLTLLLTSASLGPLTFVTGAPEGTSQHWDDTHRYLGNCTQKPVHEYFSVNDTAQYIDIVINFKTNMTFPGAILEVKGPDSYDVISENVDELDFHTNVTLLNKRGLWSVVLSMNYCTFQSPVEFQVHLKVHNRHLGTLTTDNKSKVDKGETLHILLNDFQLAQGEQVHLDLGDGRIANLGNKTTYDITYNDPGTYTIKAQVLSSDGTATGWRTGPHITVQDAAAGSSGPMTLSYTGVAIALVLIGMLALVVFLTTRP